MSSTYTQFLKDYGIQNLKDSLGILFSIVYLWFMLISIKKVVRLPNKASRLSYVIVYMFTVLLTFGYFYSERVNIGLLFNITKTDKEFVSELNRLLDVEYKPKIKGKKYAIVMVEEKVSYKGINNKKINTYYYKIDKVTTKNISKSVDQYVKTNYAHLSDFVRSISATEYNDYRLKIEEEKALELKKKSEQSKVKVTKSAEEPTLRKVSVEEPKGVNASLRGKIVKTLVSGVRVKESSNIKDTINLRELVLHKGYIK